MTWDADLETILVDEQIKDCLFPAQRPISRREKIKVEKWEPSHEVLFITQQICSCGMTYESFAPTPKLVITKGNERKSVDISNDYPRMPVKFEYFDSKINGCTSCLAENCYE